VTSPEAHYVLSIGWSCAFHSGHSKGLTKHAGGHKSIDVKHIAAHDLNKKSDKHINVQVINLIQIITHSCKSGSETVRVQYIFLVTSRLSSGRV